MLDGVCPKCHQTQVREHSTTFTPLSNQPLPIQGRILVCMECGYTEIYTHATHLPSIAQSEHWKPVSAVEPAGPVAVTGVTERLSPAFAEQATSALGSVSEHSPKKRCPACQADDIIPDVRVVDRHEGFNQNLSVEVTRKPGAVLFPRPVVKVVRAWICGRCGHTSLFAEGPDALLDAYLSSKG